MEDLDIILQSSSEVPEAVLIGGGAVLTSYLIGRTSKVNRSIADINRSLTDSDVQQLLEKVDDSEDDTYMELDRTLKNIMITQ